MVQLSFSYKGSIHENTNTYPDIPLSIIYEWKWPKIVTIPFAKTWEWIEKIDLPRTQIAKTKIQNCIISFLNGLVAKDEQSAILWYTKSLETLLINENEGILRLLKERIEVIIGSPENNKKWISSLYNLRSRIIHGSFETARIVFNDLFEDQDREINFTKKLLRNMSIAEAIIIALLQDLIINDSIGYNFKQKVEYL